MFPQDGFRFSNHADLLAPLRAGRLTGSESRVGLVHSSILANRNPVPSSRKWGHPRRCRECHRPVALRFSPRNSVTKSRTVRPPFWLATAASSRVNEARSYQQGGVGSLARHFRQCGSVAGHFMGAEPVQIRRTRTWGLKIAKASAICTNSAFCSLISEVSPLFSNFSR
jgi:hypothetical protein